MNEDFMVENEKGLEGVVKSLKCISDQRLGREL